MCKLVDAKTKHVYNVDMYTGPVLWHALTHLTSDTNTFYSKMPY